MYKPILFNTEMVRTILDNRKTVTRRVIKYENNFDPSYTIDKFLGNSDPQILISCSPYQVGDILWVRETWQEKPIEIGGGYFYKTETKYPMNYSWIPSIHMPKEAARIFLRVTGVRVEHLQDITEEQCEKEGMTEKQKSVLAKEEYWYWFKELWDSTIKKADLDTYGWNANPWVWVIEFEQCEKPLDFVGGNK